ncbi:MAG: endonuclease MutS2 [Myxococcota bacterium]
MTSFQVNDTTLKELGWPRIREALVARCGSSLGREPAGALGFLGTESEVETSLARVEEARTILRKQLEIPVAGVDDVRPAVDRVSKGAPLAATELLAVARVAHAALRVRAFGRQQAMEAPLLGREAQNVPNLGPIGSRIDDALEPSGTVRDTASDALAMYRQRARALHQQIQARIDELLRDPMFAENLRDNYFSTRNDRYVLPINASFRSRVPGIVHNASQSGQTIFVEPDQIIGLGNELSIAESLAAEEERRVLHELSEDVAGQVEAIRTATQAFASLDFVQAAARLANDLDAAVPRIVPPSRSEVVLERLRHPLLLLQGKDVVANRVVLGDRQTTLVVSGPNAGGKTVTITAAGLCALMLRAGLPIPASDASALPLVRGVLSVVGDAQSMAQGLSSFSAHMTRLKDVIEVARAGYWVLVDEIAADTDPREGAAIATAVLDHLADKEARAFVTTHLEEVKALAVTDDRFVNARVGLDPATMRPTYALQLGTAGMSNALEVAAQVGLPPAILEVARKRLHEGSQLSQALAKLDDLAQSAEADRAKARQALVDAERVRADAATLEAQAAKARDHAKAEARAELAGEIDAAREQVAKLIAQLQAAPDMREAQKAQRELGEKAQELAAQTAREQSVAEVRAGDRAVAGAVKVGGKVRVASLGKDGEVIAIEGKVATVLVGPLRTRAKLEDLVPVKAGGTAAKSAEGLRGRTRDEKARSARGGAVSADEPSTRLDIRGQRADDAIRNVEAFLDALYLNGAATGVVVHGHGTGALKEAIRDTLKLSPYVETARPGERHEGGDGVTVVMFRS